MKHNYNVYDYKKFVDRHYRENERAIAKVLAPLTGKTRPIKAYYITPCVYHISGRPQYMPNIKIVRQVNQTQQNIVVHPHFQKGNVLEQISSSLGQLKWSLPFYSDMGVAKIECEDFSSELT